MSSEVLHKVKFWFSVLLWTICKYLDKEYITNNSSILCIELSLEEETTSQAVPSQTKRACNPHLSSTDTRLHGEGKLERPPHRVTPLDGSFVLIFQFPLPYIKQKKLVSIRQASFPCCLSHRLYASHANDGIFELQSLLSYIDIKKYPRPSLPWPTQANNSLVYRDHDLPHFQVPVASSGWARK